MEILESFFVWVIIFLGEERLFPLPCMCMQAGGGKAIDPRDVSIVVMDFSKKQLSFDNPAVAMVLLFYAMVAGQIGKRNYGGGIF